MRSSIRIQIPLLLTLLLGSAVSALGQGVWDKPYQQWTMSEVEQILRDSPWAQIRDKGVYLDQSPTDAPANSSDAVIVYLRSALPVREALARLRQLRAKYDKLSDSEKKSVDEKNKVLLDCPACADNYVVTMAPGTGKNKGVPTILQTMAPDEVKLNVRISNERGETRELVHFVAPKFQGDDALFFFARFNGKGELLLTTDTKKLFVVFDQKIFNMSAFPIIKFEFDVSKMTVNGKVAF